MQTLCPESGLRTAPTWPKIRKNDNDVTIFWHVVVNFFLLLLSSLATGPNFMSISSLVLELWQFSFIKDWPEIPKLEIPLSKFCPTSGDWGKLWIPNLARMSLIQYYWILLLNTEFQGYSFYRFRVIKGKPTGG